VFEDSVSGCEAARRAGMKLVFVRPVVEIDPGKYDLVIDDFTEEDLEKVNGFIGRI
jgi:beta-phosphoglucomutase-like phosphatase (HAD superfamily)